MDLQSREDCVSDYLVVKSEKSLVSVPQIVPIDLLSL